MLTYSFMQKAFAMSLLLSILLPCIGMTIVLKRLSMLGDALSHISLSGVVIGLLLGFNPIIGAFVACVIAGIIIEGVRRKLPHNSDIAIALIMSLGIGIAGLLSSFVPSSIAFTNFLFGSIVAVTTLELIIVLIATILVLVIYLVLYRELYLLAFDVDYARLANVKVNLVELIFTILTAITVALASRIVGALLISSLLVIPVGTSLLLRLNYKKTLIISICFAIFSSLVGMTIAFYANTKPGSTIVLVSISLFLLISLKEIKIKF